MKARYFYVMAGLCLLLVSFKGYGMPDISEKTSGMTKMPGFFTLYRDDTGGKLWLEIDRWNKEFLLVNYLSGGVGSNDIGLDRGQISGEYVVFWKRVGTKVLLIQPNYKFRAEEGSEAEKKAVKESFAESVIWGFQVQAEDGQRVLVDATDFFVRDSRNVTGVLRRSGQGSFVFNNSLSALNFERTKNFPLNTEVDALVTLTGRPEGKWIRDVTPTPENVTVYEHTSLVRLPEKGYHPRRFDPRAGYFPMTYMDFSTPVDQPIEKRFIMRHRLEKKNPDAAISDPVKPIIYYVDNSAPEPIRSALVEGASWWSEAFEAIGYRDAFQVKVLPDSVDPMDIRYNVIQWVHRATRGWSYGGSVSDPRTGEIIKGHVTLGSQRIRQDFLIGKALLSPYKDGKDNDQAIEEMALARIRQLSCHEVGHTLGLAHNYAASSFGRASVMDYPHPLIRLDEKGNIDLSDAYATGVGVWDKITIAYGYSDFPEHVDENSALRDILQNGIKQGIYFLSDKDARPAGSASPYTHLWDNGTDPVAELNRLMKVREVALSRFGENAVRMKEPLALLADVLVPLYLLPRYQITAAAKVVGGFDYRYNLRGDGQKLPEPVAADRQRKAIRTLLRTVLPSNLVLPENIIKLLPPRPLGYPATRESFSGYTDPVFDPVAPARDMSEITFNLLLDPARAARMITNHALNPRLPGLDELIRDILMQTWYAPHTGNGYQDLVLQASDRVVLEKISALITGDAVSPAVHEKAWSNLLELQNWLKTSLKKEKDMAWKAHYQYAVKVINTVREKGDNIHYGKPKPVPPGQPIGNEAI
ncbi:MAG: zinc-dependent metalloprotease [Chlorobi bacterium]|nr:zinc-dependent metalloprotease [Chlorobiota bacterium]